MVSLQEADAGTRFGGSFAAGDQDGDGCTDVLFGGCGTDVDQGISVLHAGPILGRFDEESERADTNWAATLTGRAGDSAMYPASGDVNGDGLADWVIGGYGIAEDLGGAYVVYGPVYGNLHLWPQADAILLGDGENTGVDNNECMDLNGDGLSDLLISAPGFAIDQTRYSGIYVVDSPVSGVHSLAEADAVYYAGDYASQELWVAGAFSAGGDMNGDGLNDVALSSTCVDGAAWLVLSPRSGLVALTDADATILGHAYARGPGGISSGRDVDGDGHGDLIVGLSGASNVQGRAYLFHGPLAGDYSFTEADATVWAPGDLARVGHSVSLEQDMDGDGRADVAIGAPGALGAPHRGAVFLFYEPFLGTVNAFDEAEAVLYCDHEDLIPATGYYLDPAGDVNGDGFDDLHVGTDPDVIFFGGPR